MRAGKLGLVLLVCLWGTIGCIGNFSQLEYTYKTVEAVTGMAWMPEGVGPPWRTENPIVVSVGVAIIIAGKLAAAILCGFGGWRMFATLNAEQTAFEKAKAPAIIGCIIAFASLFGGFTVFGETAFLMFNDLGNVQAAQAAWRYGGAIMLIAIYLSLRERPD